MFHAKMHYKM